jgi:hypothetical protein
METFVVRNTEKYRNIPEMLLRDFSKADKNPNPIFDLFLQS